MGTITTRTNADGGTSYKAQVRIRRGGVIVHQETQTFERKQAATAWTKQVETALAKPGALKDAKAGDPILSDVIQKYIDETNKDLSKNKLQALTLVQKSTLGKERGSQITSGMLVAWGQSIKRKPATIAYYFSHLRTVYKVARPAWGYPMSKATIIEALDVLSELGVTGVSDSRDRRPTLDEVNKLIAHFREKRLSPRITVPYDLIMMFAIFSSRRISEILRMRWEEVDATACRLLVLDMKDPKKKTGNHVQVDLTPEAVRILRAVPRIHDTLIFPFNKATISNEFFAACNTLGIEDLRFHDLRHEGVSRLFELGLSIPAVAMMSGHKTWVHLKRYAHIRAFGDKYAGWKWLDIIAPLPQLPLGYVKPQS
jgi:integrase